MTKTLEKHLESISEERFEQIIPNRAAVIESGSEESPRFEYNANRVAAALHPTVQNAVVSFIDDLGEAKRITLSPDKNAGTEALAYFRAGQYVSVKLKIGESELTRPFTIASAPSEAADKGYVLVIKRTEGGFASNYISDSWTVGTKVELSAPEGDFYYEPLRDAKNVVGVAGGSGVTPFLSLAKAVADGTEDCTLTLLYGCKKESDILCRAELDRLSEECGRIKVIYVLSEEEKDGFESGFINSELIKKYTPSGDFSVFLCGPRAMYEFEENEVKKLGLSARRIRREIPGEYRNADKDADFPKEAVGKVFKITVETAGGEKKIIPAKSGESILVALERAGISAQSRCRSGVCGFCRSRLVSGSFYMPKSAENRRSADAADGYIHPCCSFPTSDCRLCLSCDVGDIKLRVKEMKKKEQTITIIMASMISFVMGALAAYFVRKGMNEQALAATPAMGMYASNILESIVAGLLIALMIPFGKWGRALADKFNARPPKFKFTLLNCLPIAIGNSILVSAVVSFINIAIAHTRIPADIAPPLMIMWISQWLKLLPLSLIASYGISVILSPFIVMLVGMPAGGPPEKAMDLQRG